MTNQINEMMTVDNNIVSKVMSMDFYLHLFLVLSVAGRLPNNSVKKVMQTSKPCLSMKKPKIQFS